MGLESEVRGSNTSFYHWDLTGTNRIAMDASGNVTSTLETDAFGNAWMPGTAGAQSPFGYAGQWGYQTDNDSGLMRVGYRYYDSSTGMFLSRDPIQDGDNWYAYCGNDPVNAVDPTGLDGIDQHRGYNPGMDASPDAPWRKQYPDELSALSAIYWYLFTNGRNQGFEYGGSIFHEGEWWRVGMPAMGTEHNVYIPFEEGAVADYHTHPHSGREAVQPSILDYYSVQHDQFPGSTGSVDGSIWIINPDPSRKNMKPPIPPYTGVGGGSLSRRIGIWVPRINFP